MVHPDLPVSDAVDTLRLKRGSILSYFAIGVGLPSAILGYLAFRGIQNDQALAERTLRNEHLRGTEAITQGVARHVDGIERAAAVLFPRPGETGEPAAMFRAESLKSLLPGIEQPFVYEQPGSVFLPWARLPYVPEGVLTPPPARFVSDPVRLLKEQGEHLEFREAALPKALLAYEQALAKSTADHEKSLVLLSIARVRRLTGEHEAARSAYGRLAREFPRERMESGSPMGLVGRMESATLAAALGDTIAAVGELLVAYAGLLEGSVPLEEPAFAFWAGKIHERIAPLLGEISRFDSSRNVFRSLKQRESALHEPVKRLGGFLLAAPAIIAAQRDVPGDTSRTGGVRMVFDHEGESYLVCLLNREYGDGGVLKRTEGILVSAEYILREFLPSTIPLFIDSTTGGWCVVDHDGKILAGRHGADDAPPAVKSGFEGSFPPWSLEVYQKERPVLVSLFTPQRSMFSVMFILVVFIALFGLAITYRSVSRELELAKLKSDFVSTVSHEFKSPVTSIRQLAEMLQSGRIPSDAKRQQYYDVIVEQSERVSLLIDNVLDFARMEEGRRTFTFEPTDVAPLLREVAARMQNQVAHAGFQIDCRVPDALPPVRVDRLSLAEAVINLLDNAVKYSGTATHVELGAAGDDARLVISVRDFGIGVHPEDRDKVFDRFYRGRNPAARRVSGTGLGLTLVKQIAEAHHGSVRVVSEVGKGSTFEIRLPRERD